MNLVELFNTNPDEVAVIQARHFVEHRCKKKKVPVPEIPKRCILGFLPQLYPYIQKTYKTEIIDFINKGHPYYIFKRNNITLSYLFPGIGAPLSVALLEESIAMGAESFIFIGTAGVIAPEIRTNELILPSTAVRDEGTSFHYAPAGRYAEPDFTLLQSLRSVLESNDNSSYEGMTWTTDAPYRETPGKIRRLRDEGCLTVDMEASALFTVGKVRRIRIAGLFLSSDGVFEDHWELEMPVRRQKKITVQALFEIAADALSISRKNG